LLVKDIAMEPSYPIKNG